MKSSLLNRFAYHDLKTHRKDSIGMSVIIWVVVMIVMLANYLTPVMTNYRYLQHQKEFGTANLSFYFADYENIHKVEDFQFFLEGEPISYNDERMETCLEIKSGETLCNENMIEFVGNPEVVAIHLESGRFPQKRNEIAVKTSVLERRGYQSKLDQTIKLSYLYHEQVYVKEFQVVGLLKDTEYGGESIVTKGMDGENYSFNIAMKDERLLYDFESNVETKGFVSRTDFEMGVTSTAFFVMIMQFGLSVIAFALLSGMTLASFEKRQRDFTLLRSIGATNRQIYYVIFLQCILLMIVPVIVSTVFTYFLSRVIASGGYFTFPVPFKASTLLMSALNIFIILLLSYFMPARSSCRKALTGTFEGFVHQYFYYRYKKQHSMRPFYLGWRQFIGNKKQMIVKVLYIFVIVILSLSLISSSALEEANEIKNEYDSISSVCFQSPKINQKDFEFMKPYVKSLSLRKFILETSQISQDGYKLMGNLILYCLNEDMQRDYQITDLKSGEIILSQDIVSENKIQVGDKIPFIDQEYRLVDILKNSELNMAIVNKDDYAKYQSEYRYEEMKILFEDGEKANCYIECAKQIAQLKRKYICDEPVFKSQRSTHKEAETMIIVAVISVSVIYIYQFIFELFNQKEDIGTFQLLGFLHKEIWQIYFYKSLYISIVGFGMGLFCYSLNCFYRYPSYSAMMWKTIYSSSFIVLGVVVVMLVVSLLPLHRILQKEGLENKMSRE